MYWHGLCKSRMTHVNKIVIIYSTEIADIYTSIKIGNWYVHSVRKMEHKNAEQPRSVRKTAWLSSILHQPSLFKFIHPL